MAGQGNKNRKPGSGNPGYGPGSGRGFSGAGIGGNVGGGFGKGSTKNKSGQGGNNNFSSKGNLTFSGFNNILNGIFGGPANALGTATGLLSQAFKSPSDWKRKQYADKNLDITDMNPSVRVNIDGEKALDAITSKIPNETIRNWVNSWSPKALKNLKINHQLYSPTKLQPGDKGWKPTGTGSIKLDPEAERYLEWMARQNPKGYTISDFEEIYKKQLDKGWDLYTAMKFNPANSISYYALIDDTQEENNNQNDNMATNTKGQVQDLYRSVLGREGDVAGLDYWTGKIDSGESTIDDVRRGMKASTEHQERDRLLQQNPNYTEADLDRRVSPGGGLFDQQNIADVMAGGAINMAPIFGPDNTWSGGKTADETYDALGNIYQQLGIQTTKPSTEWDANNPGVAQTPFYTAPPTSGTPITDAVDAKYAEHGLTDPGGTGQKYWEGTVDDGTDLDEMSKAFDHSASQNPLSSNYVPPVPPPGTANTPPGTTNTPPPTGTNQSGTNQSNWYDGYASGADWLAANPQGGESSTNSMDDFMKFMMMMSMMGGMGGSPGGYGGSQYGYGGLMPGGVQPAYNPLEQLQGSWDWFNKAFGSGSGSGGSVQGGTTANV